MKNEKIAELKCLLKDAFDDEMYERDRKLVGSTRAGIAMSHRIDALTKFLGANVAGVLQVLDSARQFSAASSEEN